MKILIASLTALMTWPAFAQTTPDLIGFMADHDKVSIRLRDACVKRQDLRIVHSTQDERTVVTFVIEPPSSPAPCPAIYMNHGQLFEFSYQELGVAGSFNFRVGNPVDLSYLDVPYELQ